MFMFRRTLEITTFTERKLRYHSLDNHLFRGFSFGLKFCDCTDWEVAVLWLLLKHADVTHLFADFCIIPCK